MNSVRLPLTATIHMSCTLRAGGKDFDATAFAATTSLPVCSVYQRGQPTTLGGGSQQHTTSGINIDVSEADFDDLTGQIRDALAFLHKHAEELGRLSNQVGIEGVSLDFGLSQRDVPAQFCYFPPDLLLATGQHQIGLEVSLYAISDE